MKTDSINIRPTTGVYATYQRLSYTHPTAISEFVDNSTQSYYTNKDALLGLEDFEKLYVMIEYIGGDKREDARLSIEDNAYGMEREDFERALILDRPPKDRSGRSEFGMGLKTAACWYGKTWMVESTQLGSRNLYRARIDVEKLATDKVEDIEIEIEETSPETHYTRVTIEELHQKISGGRTVESLKQLLGSTYREDLRSGKIEITYNGETLTFEEPAIYHEIIEDGTKKYWKKDIEFVVEHEGMHLPVHGFVAIREKGKVKDAGFVLLRRGRVIVGGPEKGYRPAEIFGESNSFAYQRLFGELHMDDWPVTQAKDNFDWYNSGLEESFIQALLAFTKDYRSKAESIRVRPKKDHVPTKEIVDQVAKELNAAFGKLKPTQEPTPTQSPTFENKDGESSTSSLNGTQPESQPTPKKPDYGTILDGPDTWEIPVPYNGTEYLINVQLVQDTRRQWLIVRADNEEKTHLTLSLNVSHPFFEPYSDDREFITIMTRFVIAMIIAEYETARTYKDGKISQATVRLKMNEVLQSLGPLDYRSE